MGSIVTRRVSFAAVAAGDYGAGDVVSDDADNGEGNDLVFEDMGRVEGGAFIVRGARFTSSVDGATWQPQLWLFNEDPTASEKDDNAAFSLAAADRSKLACRLTSAALADAGAVAYGEVAVSSLPVYGQCAPGDKRLYGILQSVGAFTNESAGMAITVELLIEQL